MNAPLLTTCSGGGACWGSAVCKACGHQGALLLLQTDASRLLILCFLQFLNYQKNNKTIIYRLLDVANQVDWVSAHREATPPSKPHPPQEELSQRWPVSVLPPAERARGADGYGDLE